MLQFVHATLLVKKYYIFRKKVSIFYMNLNKDGQFMKLTNEKDIERRSRLIYSIYRPGFSMKRAEIAQAAGYTPEYLARLISGERRVSDEAAHNLAIALNVRETYLLGVDEYMTDADFNKVMAQADNMASTINQTALAHDYFYTGDTMPELSANDRLTEEILSFIKDAVESEKRYIIKLKEKRYVDISDDEYKLFCDDISDYIHFKIQQLYNQHSKKDL